MISAESMEELLVKVQTWKTEMEKKGLRVNMGKTLLLKSLALIWTCWRNLESTPVVSVSQELVALMQSSLVAAGSGCIRNAVALRDPCAWSWVQVRPMPWDCSGYWWKRSFRDWGWKRKSLKLSQSSATLGTCSLQEVAASWLRSHAANVHGARSANSFPFSPTAICPFWPEVRCTHHVWGVWCCMQQRLGPWRWIHWTVSGVMTMPWSVGSAMSGQRTKLAQTPFSQSLASRT